MDSARSCFPVISKVAADKFKVSFNSTPPELSLVLSGIKITAPPVLASREAKFKFEVVVIPMG